ncbi:hypothetical protein [Gordonia sihwensis]|uniref:hypothetical protein n=1 Tax=Gordonia sihwensis TaxID=173559 RepID=UPI002416DAC4|nr:hypothetical protein [Gordonia sihwensis]WFN92316.1 hypothetical protein P5P27_16310 [Gordonia sihwensis]
MMSTDSRAVTPTRSHGPAACAVARPAATVLTPDALPEAAALVGDALGEVPIFNWVLGDTVDDPTVRRLLATVLLRPMVRSGCAVGVRGDERDDECAGRLRGVLGWYPADGRDPADPVELRADAERLAAHPAVARRLVELSRMDLMPAPEEGSVSIPIAALTPDSRGADLLPALVRPVEEYCSLHGCSFYVWTGVERLRDAFFRGWRLRQFATAEFPPAGPSGAHPGGTTLYGLICEPGPTGFRRAADR